MLNRLDLRAIEGDVTAHLPRPDVASEGPVAAVRSILAAVRADGDAALHRYTKEFDGIDLDTLRVDPAEIAAALERIPADVRDALYVAAGRIEAFHRTQLHEPTSYVDGGTIRSFAVPVDRAGCYVPGGRAAYPSTVLMTAIPARVAGVGQVVVCVPPDRTTGAIVDVTLAACAVAGVDEVYAIGGAQAIGALAYGTESVAKVDVICGPGNKYVAIAKREVAEVVGIASAFAGPSEIVVVADHSAPPSFAAVDVVVQAEHGPDGLAWLVCWDDTVADAVSAEVARITTESPRRDFEALQGGESMPPVGMPRLLSPTQLGRLQETATNVRCECPNHLAEIVTSLAAFEEYSKKCESTSEVDAQMHARLYRDTSRARRLLEEALVVLCRYEGVKLS